MQSKSMLKPAQSRMRSAAAPVPIPTAATAATASKTGSHQHRSQKHTASESKYQPAGSTAMMQRQQSLKRRAVQPEYDDVQVHTETIRITKDEAIRGIIEHIMKRQQELATTLDEIKTELSQQKRTGGESYFIVLKKATGVKEDDIPIYESAYIDSEVLCYANEGFQLRAVGGKVIGDDGNSFYRIVDLDQETGVMKHMFINAENVASFSFVSSA